MQTIDIIQLGLGGVGSPCLRQLLALPPQERANLRIAVIADSSGFLQRSGGFTDAALDAALTTKAAGQKLARQPGAQPLSELIGLLSASSRPMIVVDVTASDATMPQLLAAAQAGHGIVLANKRALCGPYANWQTLNHSGKLRYEATVGAGLPILSTLRYLQATGDKITAVEGTLSGTLGFLFTRLEAGDTFSAALRAAYEQGYTEPDPRDDLGGMDVARKALILARTIGQPLELRDIAVQQLFPAQMANLSIREFMAQSAELDEEYRQRQQTAAQDGRVLRFLAAVQDGRVTTALQAVAADSPFAALHGTDNLVVMHSQRYQSPLRIAGPGAGVAVTAAAVLWDMLSLAKEMQPIL